MLCWLKASASLSVRNREYCAHKLHGELTSDLMNGTLDVFPLGDSNVHVYLHCSSVKYTRSGPY